MSDFQQIYHLSDNDLDGVGCIHLTKLAYPDKKVTAKTVDRRNLDQEVIKFINKYWDKDTLLLITDMSVNPKVAAAIDQKYQEGFSVRLIDHHQTALWLNQYKWALVIVENDKGQKVSATSLYYFYLTTINNKLKCPFLDSYVELIRAYDTWDWVKYNNIDAKMLNDLYWIVGEERFTHSILVKSRISQSGFFFDDNELYMLNMENERIKRYIDRKQEQMYIIDTMIQHRLYKAGIVVADMYVSELGNKLCELNPDIDFVAIIDFGNNKISFRSIKDDIDVSTIAESFGGGGHPKAAGCSLNKEAKELFLQPLLRRA